uniref:Sm domain-containing protein n=1 Tax=Callithrix jacchus TaxID=9483 RepID=A0A8I4A1S6_CALJA
MAFHHVGQASLELLTSGDPSTLASQIEKIYGQEVIIEIKWWQTCPRILRGFDPFMNLVIDECVEMATSGQQNNIGMVVIRGNSIIMLEALERV